MNRQAAPSSYPIILVPRVPAWAAPRGPVVSDVEAAWMAGSALNSLDNLVRSDAPWLGAWRQRLALKVRRCDSQIDAPQRGRISASRRLVSAPAGRRSWAGRQRAVGLAQARQSIDAADVRLSARSFRSAVRHLVGCLCRLHPGCCQQRTFGSSRTTDRSAGRHCGHAQGPEGGSPGLVDGRFGSVMAHGLESCCSDTGDPDPLGRSAHRSRSTARPSRCRWV